MSSVSGSPTMECEVSWFASGEFLTFVKDRPQRAHLALFTKGARTVSITAILCLSFGKRFSRVLRVRNEGGESAFSYFAPHLWNKHPERLRTALTLDAFQSGLKTLLFTQACQ